MVRYCGRLICFAASKDCGIMYWNRLFQLPTVRIDNCFLRTMNDVIDYHKSLLVLAS